MRSNPERSGGQAAQPRSPSLPLRQTRKTRLARQRKRHVDSTETFPKIGLMKGPGAGKLDLERLNKTVRQHRHAVRAAFPFLDNNFASSFGVALLGSNTVMARPDRIAKLIEEFLGFLFLSIRGGDM